MARTAQEIEQSIDVESANHSQLNELQSNTSLMAFWSYAKKIIVFVALQLEILLDKHKEEVNAKIDKTETGSIDWYLALGYDYQHGDSLIIDDNRPVYSVIDETKRIVKRVAIKENNDASMDFKVVKEVSGVLTKLDITELASFTAYLFRRKIAGTKITVQSLDADELSFTADVILDPILFDANGLLLSDGTEPVMVKVNEQIKNFDFGGTFYLSKLIDKVMDIEGVKDFFITSSALNTTVFTRKVESTAGYIKLDIPNTTINYVLS